MGTNPIAMKLLCMPSVIHRSIFLSVLAVCGLDALAQDEAAPTASQGLRSTFGIKGGANWSDLWLRDEDITVNDRDGRFGFHAGLFGRFASPGALGFQIEALYDQKGTTVHRSFNTIDQEITYKFDYITVPLLVVIPLGEVAELHAGVYGGFMVLSEVSTSGDLGEASFDPDDSRFNDFDFGLVGGLAINLGLAQIGARYEHGLNDITDNDISSHVLGTSKNATAQIYLALALGKQSE